jgi:hypothetical protein
VECGWNPLESSTNWSGAAYIGPCPLSYPLEAAVTHCKQKSTYTILLHLSQRKPGQSLSRFLAFSTSWSRLHSLRSLQVSLGVMAD